MKKHICSRHFLIAIIAAFFLTSTVSSFGLALQTNHVTSMGWQMLQTSLPANPLAIAASTDAKSPDFVAVASDANNIFYFHLLDHSNLQLGWQKNVTSPFVNTDVTNLEYGLGHFVAMGTDRSSGNPVILISGDNGRTWSPDKVWTQDLKPGKGHYDNAAFSDQMGVMTGKDGAIAITTDGAHWTETTPPSGVSRKVVYSNIAPPGTPIDNEFQLCIALPPDQTTLYGFLLFHDVPILGSLTSPDGKNWGYTLPYSIMRNQLLLYQNKTFLVNDGMTVGTPYSYHDSTNLQEGDFQGLLLNDPQLPIISVFQFASYQQTWVAVGYDMVVQQFVCKLVSSGLFDFSTSVSY
ncbi:MAG: hypothetical protein FJ390_06225 [Verrucomicrobia bacterium]|nr:hypothetical protein [Verrucomicrobiota bacterium]